MKCHASIFKAYDIRGVVPDTLNVDLARALGRSFGTEAMALGQTHVAVGRDGRLSGPSLAQALMQGLVDAGVHVLDIGMVTTPQLYYAATVLCQSGIQVTGSHNPKDHNGFKMVLEGRAIHGEAIQSLRHRIEQDQWTLCEGGVVEPVSVVESYAQRIVQDIRLSRPMHVVVDSGNGVAGATAPAILRGIGCKVTELFSEVDGRFPHHHPDPSKPENLRDLIDALSHSDAELGLAFDGDGDRLGIVTRDGQTIYPDRQLMLFAKDVLSRQPGGTIVFDVKCSQRLAPFIRECGGEPLMFKTGHSLIKAQMKAIDSPLGGEMSGHVFFKERWFGFDDGTYAGCRLLEILSRSDDANQRLHALPSSHATPELNVACAEGEPHRLTAMLLDLARSQPLPSSAQQPVLCDIDGLRIDWSDGFGLVRASNTTPVLVLRFEGHTPEALARIQSDMMHMLRQVKPDAQVQEAAH